MAKAQDEETNLGDVTLRVVVAEDQPIMRSALVELLAKDPRFDIVADAADGAEAERLARQMSPDVLVTDLDMPVQDGVATIASLTQDTPVRCLALSTFGSEEWVLSALRAGASGYVVKHSEPEDIRAAVTACAAIADRGTHEELWTRCTAYRALWEEPAPQTASLTSV